MEANFPENSVLPALIGKRKATNKCCYGNCLQWEILVLPHTFQFPCTFNVQIVKSL